MAYIVSNVCSFHPSYEWKIHDGTARQIQEALFKAEFLNICNRLLQEHSDIKFISDLVYDIDFVFSETVIELGGKLVAYLPYGSHGVNFNWKNFCRYKAILDYSEVSIQNTNLHKTYAKSNLIMSNKQRVLKASNFIIRSIENPIRMHNYSNLKASADITLHLTRTSCTNFVLHREDNYTTCT